MAAVSPSRRCGKRECEVSETGICLEGNEPPQSCPFFGKTIDDVLEDVEGEVQAEPNESKQHVKLNRVSLSSGEELSLEEADKFLLRRPVKFITIVGDLDSGKTTLICALYERFLRGSFAGHMFGGSQTLIGLEKKSHYSRIDSGRAVPDTKRTSLSDGLKYFHFSLVPTGGDSESGIEVMLSDRAGEYYKKALNNSEIVSGLLEIKMAQHVALLMDGARIANPVHRSGAMQFVRQAIHAFLDGEALSETSRVQVILTKTDLLEKAVREQTIDTLLINFQSGLQRDFGNRLGELSFWEVSARDPLSGSSPPYGVEKLLESWCAVTPAIVIPKKLQITLNTEFDRLLSRTPMRNI